MNLAALRSRERNLRRGIGALAGLALLVVGVPAVLLGLSRALLDTPNPLGGMTAPWTWSGAEIKHALTRALDNQTVISTISRVGLTLAWIALAVIVLSVVLELRSLRVYGMHMPRLHGFGWSQAIARRLAAGLLALSTVLPSHVASAAPLMPRAVATLPVTAAPVNQPERSAVPVPAAAGSWTVYRVERGDSIYGIASRLAAGDRGRTREIAQEILDRNLGHVMNDGQRFTTPGVIQIGWILDVPADADVPADEDATVAAPPTVDAPQPSQETYTVQRGDSYWEIADHHLEIVLGHEPTPREVLEETHSLMDTNVERLGNRTPNSMIYSGDVLILPSPNGYHPPVEAPPETPVAPETSTPPSPPPTTSTSLPPPTAPPITTVSAPTPPTTPAAPVTARPTAPPTTIVRAETTDAQETTTLNPWAELVIGSLFATGLAATVTRLRRRRLARRTPGHRLVSTTDAAATTETVLRAESRPDRTDALHRLLGALAGHTRLEGTRPLVRAVQLTDTGIELLWTESQPSPAKAWTTTDGGWSWRTPWPNEQPDRAQARPILPTLVPIGVRADGAELLLDLETAGSLSIEGEPELVTAFTNQLVLALGASPLADNIDLITIDLQVPGAEHLERIRTSTIDTAIDWLTTRTTETGAGLTKSKAQTTFAARLLGRSNDEWEPIVVVAPSADNEGALRLADAALPGSGSVAILRNVVTAAERIILHSEHRAEWVRLGLAFTPHLVPTEAGAHLAELLTTVADAAEVELVLNDRPIRVGDEVMPDGDESSPPPQCYDVLVRVIGEVEVEGVNDHLTDAELELLVLLATIRPDGPINLDRLATLLAHDEWRTPKPRSIQARISHLRRKLGNGTDGEPLVPDSRASTGHPSRYRISPRVVTDVDLLEAAYHRARTLASSEAIVLLRQSLELVRGRPFTAASGYTWAYDNHAALRAVQVVGDVATSLIDLYGEAGEASAILWTVDRAQRAMDAPPVECPMRHAEMRWSHILKSDALTNSCVDFGRRYISWIGDEDPAAD